MTVNVETLPALELEVGAPGSLKCKPVVTGLMVVPIGLILAVFY
ncbi:hypothetical protein [Sphingomonas sp. LM7]|nr:hypothetical protein [Sphingomonas sp. LM7]